MKKTKNLLQDEKYSQLFEGVVKSLQGLEDFLRSHEQAKEDLWDLYENGEIELGEKEERDEALDNEFAGITTDHIRDIRKSSKDAGSYVLEVLGENPDFETVDNNLRGEISLHKIPEEMIDFELLAKAIDKYAKNDEIIIVVLRGKIIIYPNLESVETKLREMGIPEIKDKQIASELTLTIDSCMEECDLPAQAKILVVQTYSEEKKSNEKKNSTGQPGEE